MKNLLILQLITLPCLLFARPGFNPPWGRDAELISVKEAYLPAPSENPFTRSFEVFVRFKQIHISPIDGPRSHFRPSSSEYMLQSVREYGFFKGFVMGCDRLMRENDEAWIYRTIETEGAIFKYDPVIKKKRAFSDPLSIE